MSGIGLNLLSISYLMNFSVSGPRVHDHFMIKKHGHDRGDSVTLTLTLTWNDNGTDIDMTIEH
jgi:hypothetical protein